MDLNSSTITWHRGALFHLEGRPTLEEADGHLAAMEDALLGVDASGRIAALRAFATEALPPDAEVVDHRPGILLPGFVDTHLHFPQVHCLDAYGGGHLLEWLERHVFPAEAHLAEPRRARRAARTFVNALVAAGTTTSLIYGSQFPLAQRVLFEDLDRAGLRAIAGRTTMTVGPESAAQLLTTHEEAVALIEEEIRTWHPPRREAFDRLGVAVIPRFALSLAPDDWPLIARLREEFAPRGVWFTTHLSENDAPGSGEVTAVREAFGVRDYLDVYDGRTPGRAEFPSCLGPRSVFAHAVHCSDREFARLAATGSHVAHCPTSQLFLASGTMPLTRLLRHGVGVGLGSDIGAGDRFFLPEVANAAFKVHLSGPDNVALSGPRLLHLLTMGGARALDLDDRIGNLEPGKAADFVVLDPRAHPVLAARLEELASASPEARLFALLMGADRATLRETRVDGRRLRLLPEES